MDIQQIIKDLTFEEIAEKYWNEFGSQFDTTPAAACEGLIREAYELREEFYKMGYQADKLLEAADVMFYLLYVLRRDGFKVDDMKEGMVRKLEILKTRKWGKNTDGTYSHIKE